MIYTGIGSRSAKDDKNLMNKMSNIASYLAEKGNILRSGAAEGADTAFEVGHKRITENNLEIFIPWKNFVKSLKSYHIYQIDERAEEIVSNFHSAWSKCSQGARKLHSRNVCQILGKNLDTPSNFVICWTNNGETIGGTATAIRIAESRNIPVYNLGLERYFNLSVDELIEELRRDLGDKI